MDASREYVGEMQFHSEIGLCGHPGLAADIYSLAIGRPGNYRFEVSMNKFDDYDEVAEIRIIRDGAISPVEDQANRHTGISIESHGGVVFSEQNNLTSVREYFDRAELDHGSASEALWNKFADGWAVTGSQRLRTVESSPAHEFLFIPCNEWLAATPLIEKGEICGYTIQCRCDADGEAFPALTGLKK